MEIKELLCGAGLFSGLDENDLAEIAALCTPRQLNKGEYLVKQGEFGREFYIISDGLVEVVVQMQSESRVITNLGSGQIIGEMSLVDHGPRSASVKSIHDPTLVQVIQNDEFQALCKQNTKIGYMAMLNLAADLSFKLRHSNLSEY